MVTIVREHAVLTTDDSQASSLDMGIISVAMFDWLISLQQKWSDKARLFEIKGKKHLKLDNFVGYLQSPQGEGIEILPKTELTLSEDSENARKVLNKMLAQVSGISPREAEFAQLNFHNQPLHEWIIEQFLNQLSSIYRRGFKFDYETIEEESTFIRGQLDMIKQTQQTPDKAAKFHIRYAEFTPQRIENRLLRTALEIVFLLTKSSENWRRANHLRHLITEIEPLSAPLKHWDKWQDGKHLVAYRAIKPWCKLVLEKLNPSFQEGNLGGIAFLFPMEKLFEAYVGICLRRHIKPGSDLKTQVKQRYLTKHCPDSAGIEQSWFLLNPDYYINHQGSEHILDAKWKLVDSTKSTTSDKYDLAQSDFYQLFAYGQKYLDGSGSMMLIYPKHANFQSPLPKFEYDDSLSLWCVPFDLDTGKLIEGDWLEDFDCFENENIMLESPTA